MKWAVRGDDLASRSIGGAILEIADLASRLLDDEKPGGDIPGMQFEFPIGIEPARGDITKIQRRAAVATNSAGGLDDTTESIEIVVVTAMYIVGESGRDQRSPQFGLSRNRKTSGTEPRALSTNGLESLVE